MGKVSLYYHFLLLKLTPNFKVLFLINMGILTGADPLVPSKHVLYLSALASLGYFFIYSIQLIVQVLGEKIPPLMVNLDTEKIILMLSTLYLGSDHKCPGCHFQFVCCNLHFGCDWIEILPRFIKRVCLDDTDNGRGWRCGSLFRF